MAARNAFAERLQRVRVHAVAETDRARVRDIIERARRRSIRDSRTEDDILGYDENGIPRP